jgi:hypothetical protein
MYLLSISSDSYTACGLGFLSSYTPDVSVDSVGLSILLRVSDSLYISTSNFSGRSYMFKVPLSSYFLGNTSGSSCSKGFSILSVSSASILLGSITYAVLPSL